MKKTSLTALALTGAMALGAVPAHAQDNDMAHRVEEVTNAAIKAFEAHGEKTYTANAWFSVDGIGEGMDVEWAIPISTSQELIDFIAPSDERFRAALDNLKPVEHYTNPVGAPTPARAANGQIVVVLPHSGAVTVNGGIVIEDLQSGGMVQMTEDEKSSVPVVSPSADVKLLFGSGDKTSTYDPSGAATQSVGNNGHMAQYTRDNGETGTVIENERGEEQDVDINLAGNIDNLPVLNPGDRVRLTIDANVTNTTGQDLTYSVQPYGTTEDVDVDKRDGTEDGLYPITDEDNRPVEGRTTVSGNDTQVTVEFVVPDDGLVYLNHRLLDEDGNDVAPLWWPNRKWTCRPPPSRVTPSWSTVSRPFTTRLQSLISRPESRTRFSLTCSSATHRVIARKLPPSIVKLSRVTTTRFRISPFWLTPTHWGRLIRPWNGKPACTRAPATSTTWVI